MALGIGLALASGASGLHAAAKPSWAGLPYKYIIIDQDIRDIFTEFGRNLKIQIKISPTIGALRVRSTPEMKGERTAEAFLQALCDSYGFVWYSDGTTLFISGQDEISTELIRVDRVKVSDAVRQLDDLQMPDPRFSIRPSDDGVSLAVAGPPAYRLAVRNRLSGQRNDGMRPAREINLKDDAEVRVFRGGS